jgi:hypothetical protein
LNKRLWVLTTIPSLPLRELRSIPTVLQTFQNIRLGHSQFFEEDGVEMWVVNNEGSLLPQGGDYGRELLKICFGPIAGVDSRVEDIFNEYLLFENQIHHKIISNLIRASLKDYNRQPFV